MTNIINRVKIKGKCCPFTILRKQKNNWWANNQAMRACACDLGVNEVCMNSYDDWQLPKRTCL